MNRPSIGISVSDYSEERGHSPSQVYCQIGHIEYGGFDAPADDREFRHALVCNSQLAVGRHLVSTELPSKLDIRAEAGRILDDLRAVPARYLLTDAEYWHLGGRSSRNVWVRPCSLTPEMCDQIIWNCHALEQEIGLPIWVENPAFIEVEYDFTVSEFFYRLAEGGAGLCFDVGHFLAFCVNESMDPELEFSRLPFEAIHAAHVAGLSRVQYMNKELVIDNHDIQPPPDCLEFARQLVQRAPNLKWLTYEAELASVDVQIAGLRSIMEKLDGRTN